MAKKTNPKPAAKSKAAKPKAAVRKRKRAPAPPEPAEFALAMAEAILALPPGNSEFEARRTDLGREVVRLREYLS